MDKRHDTAAGGAPLVVVCCAEIELTLFLRHLLEGEGLTVEIALACDDALDRIVSKGAVLALIDAEIDGALDLCRLVRETTEQSRDQKMQEQGETEEKGDREKKKHDEKGCRIVVLVSTKSLEYYPDFLAAGMDEGLMRPVDPATIVAAVWRNSRSDEVQNEPDLTYLDIEIDMRGRRVTRGGREVGLTRIEFELLVFLMQDPITVHSRKALIAGVWPQGVFVDPRTVNIHIGRLPRRLVEHGGQDVIRTVRASGYALDKPDAKNRKG